MMKLRRLMILDHNNPKRILYGFQDAYKNVDWLTEVGMDATSSVVDFEDVKHVVKDVVERTLPNNDDDPKYIANQVLKNLQQELNKKGLTGIDVAEVTVWESPKAGATVYNLSLIHI